MTKPTKRDYFNRILPKVADDPELVDFVNRELELLERKNARRSDKPTAKQTANAELMTVIYDTMEAGVPYTATDIKGLVPELSEANLQKTVALVSKMRDNVMVSREVVKGKAYFTKI
jgi:hypothetical protein